LPSSPGKTGVTTHLAKESARSYEALVEKYNASHKEWRPRANPPLGTAPLKDPPAVVQRDAFISYVHTPKILGEEPIPSLTYHTSCEVGGIIYTNGGVKALNEGHSGENVDLSRFSIKGVTLPLPINSRLLNHPCVIPNDDMYLINSVTNHVTKRKTYGDVPPPLLCMSASQITKRHIFYYGGLELINHVVYDEGSDKIFVEKRVKLNNSAYVLDTVTMKFNKFELTAHPNKLTRFPITVPRFGHSSTSVDLSRALDESLKTETPASVFIMGGYRETSVPNRYEAIRDLWKVELSIVYEGLHGYIEFGDVVLATPIPIPEDSKIPAARAFHAVGLVDSEFVFGVSKEFKGYSNPHRLGLGRPSSPTSLGSEAQLNLRLVAHGGTDGHEILGDVWYFDFDKELWYEHETFFMENDTLERAQLRKVGHHGQIIDKYLVTFMGAIPMNFSSNLSHTNNGPRDISSALESRSSEELDRRFYYVFSLHLPSGTWVMYKIYHSHPTSVEAFGVDRRCYSDVTGSTHVIGNLRTFVIGGNMLQNPRDYDLYRSDVLNSAITLFEFPLALSVNNTNIT
jgi:hypothetical protein